MNPLLDRKAKPFWYRFHIGECPVCGRDQGWKERVNGVKPKDPRKRYVTMPDTDTYDYCDDL